MGRQDPLGAESHCHWRRAPRRRPTRPTLCPTARQKSCAIERGAGRLTAARTAWSSAGNGRRESPCASRSCWPSRRSRWLPHAAAQPKKDIGYDPRANAFEQLDAAVAEAAAADKLVLLISGGDWCSWCHYLAAFLEREDGDRRRVARRVRRAEGLRRRREHEQGVFRRACPRRPARRISGCCRAAASCLASQDTLPLEDGAKSYDRASSRPSSSRWRERAPRAQLGAAR